MVDYLCRLQLRREKKLIFKLRNRCVTHHRMFPVTYLAPCQAYMMEHFAKITNAFQLLIIFAKCSTTDV